MLGNSIKKFALNQAFNYIEKDPIKNLTHVMDMVDKFAGSGPQSFPRQRQAIRDAINNEDSTAHGPTPAASGWSTPTRLSTR